VRIITDYSKNEMILQFKNLEDNKKDT
jgi:hypothetical protein